MLKLVLNKNNVSNEYDVDLSLNKNILNNVNRIVLQDLEKTIIIDLEGPKSINGFKGIIDFILKLDIISIDKLKDYFDDIKDNKVSENSDLTILEQLLINTNFSYVLIDSLDAEAGEELLDESAFLNNNSEITQNEYNLTNRTQLQNTSTFINIKEFAAISRLQMFGKSTFCKIQKKYLFPSINYVYKKY